VKLRYPDPGQAMHLADAVVADCSDNAALSHAELLVDGRATGQVVDLQRRPGRAVFPLLLRSLDPREHSIAVEVTDSTGNVTRSDPSVIDVLAETPGPGRYERAIRLLNRFAYGPDPDALAGILVDGEMTWLAESLQRPLIDPGDLAALGAGLPRFVGQGPEAITGRVLSHLLLTPNPARARFVLWAENHFSTWLRKIGAETKWTEHVTYARLGASRFDRLLFASAESPAMLVYLDQVESYVGRLNENYAREIMELHTLGVDGGYRQSDVTNLAHLLTGWTASLEGDGRSGGEAARAYTFRFDPRLNDGGPREVFGVQFPGAEPPDRFDRAVLAIEHLASHPSTARHIARKLIEHFIALPAPGELVEELAGVFLSTGGNMVELIAAIARHDAFLNGEASSRVAQPLDYAVRLFRVTGHPEPDRVEAFLRASGQGIFDRPTPDGYPDDDAAYIDSNTMVQRWKLALDVTGPLCELVPPAWRASSDAVAERWEQAVVDILAVRLTGRVLGEASNRAALELLAATGGTPEERVRVIAPFIAQVPEANLR
jgi:hypothetical protein